MRKVFKSNSLDKGLNFLAKEITLYQKNNKFLPFLLVTNRIEGLRMKKKLESLGVSNIKATSYFGFVQKEVTTYWDLILSKSRLISKKVSSPELMTFEAAQYLMEKTVEFYRKKGFFQELSYSNKEISKKLLSNLLDASLNNLVYTNISKKYKEFGDSTLNKIYDEMNEVINKYIERIFEKGVLDYGSAIYLFQNILLSEPRYLKELEERKLAFFVTSLELSPPGEIDFLTSLLPKNTPIIATVNSIGSFGIYIYNSGYYNTLIDNPEFPFNSVLSLEEKEKKRELELLSFLDEVEDNVFSNKLISKPNWFHLSLDHPSKGDLIKGILSKITSLLESGVSYRDITIISPREDLVLYYALGKLGETYNFPVKNINRSEEYTKDIATKNLLSGAIIFYRFKDISLNFDDLKVFLSTTLGLDLIRSALLANYIINNSEELMEFPEIKSKELLKRIPSSFLEKYKELKGLFQSLDPKMPIWQFFELLFHKGNLGSFDVKKREKAFNLIDASKKFTKTLSKFYSSEQLNFEFLNFVVNGAKPSESLSGINERLNEDFLTLSSTIPYITAGIESKIQIWYDLSDPTFIPNNYNNIQNSWILSKQWDGDRFALEDEIHSEKKNTLGIFKRLLSLSSGEVYLYGTSSNNFSNTRLLTNIVRRII